MIYFSRIDFFNIQYKCQTAFEEKVIRNSLTFDFPGYQFTKAYNEYNWDGKVRLYDKRKNTFKFGLLSLVLENIKSNHLLHNDDGVDYKLIDINYDGLTDTLYQHQSEAIKVFFKTTGYGVIKVPTRGGKTFIASECIRLVKRQMKEAKILFLVDGVDLLKQTMNDVCSFNKIDKKKVGIIQATNFKLLDINFCTIQTLQSILNKKIKIKHGEKTEIFRQRLQQNKDKKEQLIAFIKSIDFLICDEIHESIASDSRIEIIEKFNNLKLFLSLSATPFKSGEQIDKLSILKNIKLKSIVGDLLYDIASDELKQKGILANEKILLLTLQHHIPEYEYEFMKKNEPKNKYLHYANRIIFENPQRDNVILMVLNLLFKLRIKTLCLFSSKKHGNQIEKLTGYKFISGDNPTEERDYWKKWFLSGRGKVLLSSDIYKKGITLPQVEVIFNIDGGKEDSLIIQRKGRVLGVTKDKKNALVIDFIDLFDKYFSEHSLNRIKVYENNVGIDNIDVIETEENDFYEQIKEYFTRWCEK